MFTAIVPFRHVHGTNPDFDATPLNISESVMAKEITEAATCCIFGVLNMILSQFFLQTTIFFQNGCHIARVSTLSILLSDFDKDLYFVVIWCAYHECTIQLCFGASIFFVKMAVIWQECQLCLK